MVNVLRQQMYWQNCELSARTGKNYVCITVYEDIPKFAQAIKYGLDQELAKLLFRDFVRISRMTAVHLVRRDYTIRPASTNISSLSS